MKYKLSKKIAYKIVKEEIKNTNINVNVELVNKYENIYNIIKKEFKRKLNDNQRTFIETISEIKKELKREYFAKYDQFDNSFKICLTTIKNSTINKRDYLWNLIISTYHEYKHALIYNELQSISNFKIDSLYNFYILIDYLIDSISNYYEIKPENFYEEIIADVYANQKTTEFLNNYPNLKSKLKLYIEKDKIFTDINYQNYDVQRIINIIHKIIKCNSNRYNYFDSIFPYGIVSVLYHNNGTFKDIKTLITEKDWNNYPKEVQYLIISSKAYLEDINYENITKEELEIIEQALEYTYNLEKKRYQTNKQIKTKIFKLHNQTKKSKCQDKKFFKYDDLLLMLKEKEIYNTNKLEYLDYQISKIAKLLHNKKIKVKMNCSINNN